MAGLTDVVQRSMRPSSDVSVFILLLAVTVVVRLPFFFPAVVDWDESTLILMGQNILDGRLPYLELWDIKPPLSFVTFALIIGVFGDSIVSVRIGGLVFLTGTAFLIYLVGKSIWNRRAGFLAAILCIVFVSMTRSGQATMTETIAMLPLVGALALLCEKKHTISVLFAAGFLISAAAMIRLNLAYVAVLVGFYLAINMIRRSNSNLYAGLCAYVLGGFFPVTLLFFPYLVLGHSDLWISSVFLAPLNYSGSGYTFLEGLQLLVENGFSTNGALWVTFLAGTIWLVSIRSQLSDEQRQGIILIGVFLFGTAYSVVSSGAAHQHYLIQVVPFFSLIAGAFIDRLAIARYRLPVLLVFVLTVLVSLRSLALPYWHVAERWASGQPLMFGPAFKISAFLKEANPNKKPVYLMTDHIVYWLTETKPLTRATTHPSNIAKEFILESFAGRGASTNSEMARVLKNKPTFIVKKQREWYLSDKPEARRMLNVHLQRHYRILAVIDGRYIFGRKFAE